MKPTALSGASFWRCIEIEDCDRKRAERVTDRGWPLLSLGETMNPGPEGVYFDLAGVASVRWDEDGQLVLVEWQGWANPSEFSDLLEAEIAALREHRGTRMLADCRRQKGLSAADQDRANENWLPRALAAGLKRVAVVVPSSGLAAGNLRERLDKARPDTLEIAYFATPDEARDWIGR